MTLLSCDRSSNTHKIKGVSNFDTAFNQIRWNSGNLYIRGRMSKDLVSKNYLRSISTDSLFGLLGVPSEKAKHFYTYLILN